MHTGVAGIILGKQKVAEKVGSQTLLNRENTPAHRPVGRSVQALVPLDQFSESASPREPVMNVPELLFPASHSPPRIIQWRTVSLLPSMLCRRSRYSAASVGPKPS